MVVDDQHGLVQSWRSLTSASSRIGAWRVGWSDGVEEVCDERTTRTRSEQEPASLERTSLGWFGCQSGVASARGDLRVVAPRCVSPSPPRCCSRLVAAVLTSPASAAPRMAIGFHDDATFRWSPGAADAIAKAGAAHASVIRTIADWRALAPQRPTRGGELVRSGVQLPRPRRARAERPTTRNAGDDHDLGHASLGERRQRPQRCAQPSRRPDGVQPGDRRSLLGPPRGLPLRRPLLDLERAEPRDLPGPAVRPGWERSQPAHVRRALPRRLRGGEERERDRIGGDR